MKRVFLAIFLLHLPAAGNAVSQAQGSGSATDSPVKIHGHRGELAEVLKPYVDRGELPGAVVLVASKDKVLTLEAIGSFDHKAQQSYEPDSLFGMASQGKTYTAAALMMLADEGKISLDDPVDKYLPEFKDVRIWKLVKADGVEQYRLAKPANRMLVRHLLNHTSGLEYPSGSSQLPLPPAYPRGESQITLATRVQGLMVFPLQAEPGTRSSYNSAGPSVAGRIIEVVSKMPYNVFLRQRLLEPLGMKKTAARLAASANTSPAGGLRSTAEENARFGQMVLNGGVFDGKRFLSEKNLRRMVAPQPGVEKEPYRLGWVVNEDQTFWTGGSGTKMTIDRKHGLVLVFMTRDHPGNKTAEAVKAFETAAIAKFGKPN